MFALLAMCIGCTTWDGAMISHEEDCYYLQKTTTFLFFSSTTVVKVRSLDVGELKGRFVVVCDATPPLTAAGIKNQAVRAQDKARYCKKKGHSEKGRLWTRRYEKLKRLYRDITKKEADIPEEREKPEPQEPDEPEPAEDEPDESEEDSEDESGWGD